jgi:hypothetical protein
VFQEFVKNPATARFNAATIPTGFVDILTDTTNVALFNSTTAPDKDAVVGSTGYNTGVWVTGNEVTDATNWVAGGRPLASKVYSDVANAMMFDAADLAGGGTVTLAANFGCLVYDNAISAGTVAKQGICFNYFGGAQQVTGGTFTMRCRSNS